MEGIRGKELIAYEVQLISNSLDLLVSRNIAWAGTRGHYPCDTPGGKEMRRRHGNFQHVLWCGG